MTQPPDRMDAPLRAQWGAYGALLSPTTNALAFWSWVDLARHLLGGLAGGAVATLLAVLLAPDAALLLAGALPPLAQVLTVLLWTLPLTAGLCLADGHLGRALAVWLRALLRALIIAAVGSVVLGLLLLLAPRASDLYLSATWVGIALLASLACWGAFPRARHLWQHAVAGVLAGLVLIVLTWYVLHATTGIPGYLGPTARQFGLLLPAGLILGFAQGFVREVAKSEWLLVVHGEQPGRLYPLYGVPFSIGAAADNLLVVDAAGGVHDYHATIRTGATGAHIEGCGEETLVFLHDRCISVSELYDGDEIQIGETVLRYYRIH